MIPELFWKIKIPFTFIGNEDPVSDIDSNNGIKLVTQLGIDGIINGLISDLSTPCKAKSKQKTQRQEQRKKQNQGILYGGAVIWAFNSWYSTSRTSNRATRASPVL